MDLDRTMMIVEGASPLSVFSLMISVEEVEKVEVLRRLIPPS